jgi:hypothetical protein
MGKFKYPFNTRIPGVPDALVTALASNFRQAATMADASGGGSAVPIGGIIDYYGTVEPAGWLFPTGQAIDPVLYPDAVTIIGANTPDLRGLTTVMCDLSRGVLIGTDTLGTAVTTGQTHALTQGQMPPHNHPASTAIGARANFTATAFNTGGGAASWNSALAGINITQQLGKQANVNTSGTGTDAQRSDQSGGSYTQPLSITANVNKNLWNNDQVAHAHSFTPSTLNSDTHQNTHVHDLTVTRAGAAGGTVNTANGEAHNNMQPHMRVNKLIRVA